MRWNLFHEFMLETIHERIYVLHSYVASCLIYGIFNDKQ